MELSVQKNGTKRSIIQEDSVPEESLHAYLETCDLDGFADSFDE